MKSLIRYLSVLLTGTLLLFVLFITLVFSQSQFAEFIKSIKEPKCLKNYGCGSGGANQKKKHHSKKKQEKQFQTQVRIAQIPHRNKKRKCKK